MDMSYQLSYYDPTVGWENTQPGWYEHRVHVGADLDTKTRAEVLEWLYNKIDNCQRHARWASSLWYVDMKFRYERDVIMCKLRF